MKNKILVVLTIISLTCIGLVQAAPPGPTIVDVAIAANNEGGLYEGQFDILIAAVSNTPEVLDILNGNGQYTVFAPTDAAFEDLAVELGLSVDELVEFLLNNPDYLETVLRYHIANGRLYAEDVLLKDRINTVIKGKMGFLYQDSAILTDNLGREANIIVTDVETANGIIHAIDTVVLPFSP